MIYYFIYVYIFWIERLSNPTIYLYEIILDCSSDNLLYRINYQDQLSNSLTEYSYQVELSKFAVGNKIKLYEWENV